MNYIDHVIDQLEQLTRPYGYTIIPQFDDIIIKTKFEKWKFTPKQGGKIRLLHFDPMNDRLSNQDAYHQQFRRDISLPDLVKYIHEHELGKFDKRFVNFTFNKDGSPKT